MAKRTIRQFPPDMKVYLDRPTAKMIGRKLRSDDAKAANQGNPGTVGRMLKGMSVPSDVSGGGFMKKKK